MTERASAAGELRQIVQALPPDAIAQVVNAHRDAWEASRSTGDDTPTMTRLVAAQAFRDALASVLPALAAGAGQVAPLTEQGFAHRLGKRLGWAEDFAPFDSLEGVAVYIEEMKALAVGAAGRAADTPSVAAFRKALDKLQLTHGDWARTKWDHPADDRNALAAAAVEAENEVILLFVRAARGGGDAREEQDFADRLNIRLGHADDFPAFDSLEGVAVYIEELKQIAVDGGASGSEALRAAFIELLKWAELEVEHHTPLRSRGLQAAVVQARAALAERAEG